MSVLVQIVAAVAFLLFAFSLFRFSMGLRWAKVSREAARNQVLEGGQRLLAELPLPSGEVAFLVEDATSFAWGEESYEKARIIGARMRLNGGVLAEFTKDEVRLPPPEPPEEYEGRERWDVALFGADGVLGAIPCGILREGVSREVATIVFDAVKRGVSLR